MVVNNVYNEHVTSNTSESHEMLNQAKTKLQNEYELIEKEKLEIALYDIENANILSQHGKCLKLINTGRKKSRKGIIKARNNEERIKKWFDHFKNHLGGQKSHANDNFEPTKINNEADLQISTENFTTDEYVAVKNNLIDGKAAGPDGISPEILKYCNFDSIILSYANDLFMNGKMPNQWSTCHIIHIPKSGNLNEVDNYRGIALSAIALKITNKMILRRIQPIISATLRNNQNGFRPGKSTTTHILALRRLIEGVKSKNMNAIITYVDFRKAFDSIDRGRMFKILIAYGIPQPLVNMISITYENTEAKVLTPDSETNSFHINSGVLQGDTLEPFLFIIVLDYAMRSAIQGREEELGFELEPKKSRRYPATILTDLSYADDIALVSHDVCQAQQLLTCVEEEAACVEEKFVYI